MQIRRLRIEGFGKLKQLEVQFEPGLNIVYGPNESGKTTMYNFVRSCLCGLSGPEKERYRPWDGSKFGGEIRVLIEGEDLSLNSDAGPKLLERNFADSLIFLSDEEDIVLKKAEDSLIARLKSNIMRVEEAQLLNTLLSRIPEYGEKLLEQRKDLESQLREIDEEIEKFRRVREERFSRFEEACRVREKISLLQEERSKLLSQIENLNEKIEETSRQIEQELTQKLNHIDETIENEKRFVVLDEQQFQRVCDMKARYEEASALLEERTEKKAELSKLLQETIRERDALLNSLETSDLQTFKLKLKNAHLAYKLLETNLQQVREFESGYEERWKIFERLGESFVDELFNEALYSQDQEQAQLRSRLNLLEKRATEGKKKIGRLRVLSIILLLLAGTSALLGLTMTNWYFIFAAIFGGASLFSLFGARSLDKQLSQIEEEMVKCQLELRAMEKRKSSALRRLFESFRVRDISELKEIYERYKSWLKEKEKFERLKAELEKETENLLKELRQYGATEISDVPSVILRLEEQVRSIEEKNLEIARLKDSIEVAERELELLEQQKRTRKEEFEKLLLSHGLETFEDAQSAHERYLRIENLSNEKKKIESMKKCVETLKPDCLSKFYPQLLNLLNEKSESENLLKRVEEELSQLQEKLAKLEEHDDERTLQNVVQLLNRRSYIEKQIAVLNSKLERLPAFSQFLSSELENLTGSYIKRFASLFVSTFRRFSNLSESIVVDKDLSVRIAVGSDLKDFENVLSRATLDQMVLSYKLALHDVLDLPEPLPLILDNFLIRFDEERLKIASELLLELSKKRQVILLTSDKRLLDLLKVEPVLQLIN